MNARRILAITALLPSIAVAQVKRTAGELSAGIGAGIGGVIAGGMLGAVVARAVRDSPFRGYDDQIDPIALVGMGLGQVTGTALAVFAAGKRLRIRE